MRGSPFIYPHWQSEQIIHRMAPANPLSNHSLLMDTSVFFSLSWEAMGIYLQPDLPIKPLYGNAGVTTVYSFSSQRNFGKTTETTWHLQLPTCFGFLLILPLAGPLWPSLLLFLLVPLLFPEFRHCEPTVTEDLVNHLNYSANVTEHQHVPSTSLGADNMNRTDKSLPLWNFLCLKEDK